ncbi:hypothetical protein BUE80_DR000724 [Diplocarpon rosae]|nr:hypothetical protein BUE80_DR000724 [Diplocarpon rosae]
MAIPTPTSTGLIPDEISMPLFCGADMDEVSVIRIRRSFNSVPWSSAPPIVFSPVNTPLNSFN